MYLKKSFIILFVFLGFASCKQESIENEYNNLSPKKSIYTTYMFNGEDMTAGEIHNTLLSEILNETVDLRNGNPLHDLYVILDYVENEYEDITFLINNWSFESQLVYFNDNSTRSQEYINLVNNLAEEIKHIDNYSEAIELVSLYHIEIENYDLSNEEHELFMNGLSIIEASADYWYNGEGLGNKKSGNIQNRGIMDCGGNVVGADWVSAVVGAATGGPIGGFLGAAVSSAFAYFTDSDC